MRGLPTALHPHRAVSTATAQGIAALWVVGAVVAWAVLPSVLIPSPWDVFHGFVRVWADGLVREMLTSLTVTAEALGLTVVVSLVLAYLTVVPAFRPLATAVAKSRFLGMIGLTFLFTLVLGGGHVLKVALLVFGMSVFMVDTMVREVAAIQAATLDHARTLRMGEWRVVGEVVILGTLAKALEVARQQAAMGWMLLPMVEGLVRSEGGVGTMLLAQAKHFHLAEVFAIQGSILLVGLGQDIVLRLVRAAVCPYADLGLERR